MLKVNLRWQEEGEEEMILDKLFYILGSLAFLKYLGALEWVIQFIGGLI